MFQTLSNEKVDFSLNYTSILPGAQLWTEATLLTSGKKLRPKLALLMGEAVGVSAEQLAPYARIAELVHSATLAHDDVIDQATERRSAPTLNFKLTQARAVLSGDLLLARAMIELSELGSLALVKRLAQVLEDLVSGEWLQLENRGNWNVDLRSLDEIARLKTSSLLAWCTELPLHLKGAEPEQIRWARSFGEHLGLAFQFGDDCLDFSNDSGKGFSKDLKEGLFNQVTLGLVQKEPKLKAGLSLLYSIHSDFEREDFDGLVDRTLMNEVLAEVWSRARLNANIAKDFLSLLVNFYGDSKHFQSLFVTVDHVLERSR
jgi:geranylgeranyl pyrophosphate synthase